MTKKELRQYYKQKRTALSATEREMMSLQIAQQLSICDIWGYNCYHLFLSIKKLNEVDTTPILQLLYEKNKQVVVPKMNSEKRTLLYHLLKILFYKRIVGEYLNLKKELLLQQIK